MASPMPWEPPVTMATLSLSFMARCPPPRCLSRRRGGGAGAPARRRRHVRAAVIGEDHAIHVVGALPRDPPLLDVLLHLVDGPLVGRAIAAATRAVARHRLAGAELDGGDARQLPELAVGASQVVPDGRARQPSAGAAGAVPDAG